MTSDARPRLIVLTGPTAVGKTALALALAEAAGGQIVNTDSMQVYQGMDIGTAKATEEEQARARHHLIDVAAPDEEFDVARYLALARPLVEELDRAGAPALAVGGTGFYLRSLVHGLFEGPGRDEEVRARLEEKSRQRGIEALHGDLVRVDPEAAGRIHPRDRARLIRALEVFELTGRPISSFQQDHALAERPYRTLFIALDLERAQLYERIARRTQWMFASGLLEETRELLDQGYGPELKPMRAIGYREAVLHLAGRLSLERAVDQTQKKTRNYAKRQLTWLRKQKGVTWARPDQGEKVLELVRDFLAL